MKEFRIALVCYGGVSLAVYMHGVVKEIHKLVRASAAYDQFRNGEIKANPFNPETDTEYAYWDVLDRLEKYQPTRVVVDVISGASAGGINGIFLAKGLAYNLSQEHLRDMWLEDASMQELTTAAEQKVPWYVRWMTPFLSRVTGLKKILPEFQNAYGHLVAFTFQAVLTRAVAPPFDGDRMLRWLYDGLAEMDRRPMTGVVASPSLLPSNQTLELFVTTTDFYGYPNFMPVHDPAGRGVHDQKYRHVLSFLYDNYHSMKSELRNNAELAFAARATSSLPGGFSPAQIGDLQRVLGERMLVERETFNEDSMISRLFRNYVLAGADARKTCFADGGILDNQPFSNAIRAIAKRSATRQVVRRILYIDPHPISEPAPADGRLPGTFETLLASLSRIPKHEPVHDEIWNLNTLNRRIQRINDAVEASAPLVDRLVHEVGETNGLALVAGAETLEAWRRAVNAHAVTLELAGYASYVGFKLRSMADDLATHICSELNYPGDSGHALFVRNILQAWMTRRGLLPITQTITAEQTQFLKLFDIGFRGRRLRFLIREINNLYPRARKSIARPTIEDLDNMKHALYDLMDDYRANLAGGARAAEFHDMLQSILGEEAISERIRRGQVDPETFLNEYGERIDTYYTQLHQAIWGELAPLHLKLSSIVAGCAEWRDDIRDDFLKSFVGFPFWDILIFPLSDMGDVGELYEIKGVRLSPNDSVLLIDGGAERKLRGVRYQHFGAFFSRYARENDYLWGRLDAAERLIDILVDATLEQTEHNFSLSEFMPEKLMALDSILNAEEKHLGLMHRRIAALRKMLERTKARMAGTAA
jgi:patatin-related protein